MGQIRGYLSRRLTVWETVGAVVVVCGLAGLVCLAYNFITAKRLEAKVNAAIPQVVADIRTQRNNLVGAIEAYKAQFGAYPPDHVISRRPLVIDPVTNTLLYELAGVIYNPTNKTFMVGELERADAQFVKEFFQCDGFTNCAVNEVLVKRFLPSQNLPRRQLHDDPDVFALGFNLYSEEIDQTAMYEIDISPWRYVSTSPTNNPTTFDLWIELVGANRTVTIGNWKAAN